MNSLKILKNIKEIVFFLFILFPLSVYGLPMMEEQTEISPLRPEGQVPEAPPLTLPLTEPPRSSARRLPELMELNAPVMYSRTVKADVGQQVEIPFGGNGWVFLGEKTGQTGVSYQSHRFDAEGQTFLFEAEKNGVYELEFYKQDFIRDFLIDDHIKVIVESAVSAGSGGNAKISRSPVVAQPRWPTIAQESAWAAGDKAGAMPPPPTELPSVQTTEKASQAVDGKTVPQEQTSAVLAMTSKVTAPESGVLENEGPDAYLEQARKAFDVNDLVSVLGVLDQFSERFPSGNDEAWWLYARAFEANGPTKDVKSARYYYQRLVTEFPLSSHWTDAQNRIKYLDRYYFNIQ